jgi:hypothetical protein
VIRERLDWKGRRRRFRARGGEDLAIQVRHPEMTVLLLVVYQPDADLVTLALVGKRPQQRPEKTVDVRLTGEEIDGELHDVGLNLRETFCAAPFQRFLRQR